MNPLRALLSRLTQTRVPPTARQHLFFNRCRHGVQYLDECADCPGGCPVIDTDLR